MLLALQQTRSNVLREHGSTIELARQMENAINLVSLLALISQTQVSYFQSDYSQITYKSIK